MEGTTGSVRRIEGAVGAGAMVVRSPTFAFAKDGVCVQIPQEPLYSTLELNMGAWYSIGELQHYRNAEERRDAIRRWRSLYPPKRYARSLVWFALITCAISVVGLILTAAFARYAAIWGLIAIPLVAIIVLLASGLKDADSFERAVAFRRFVRHDLISRGICWRCGYDLTGNVTGVCSECRLPIADRPKLSLRQQARLRECLRGSDPDAEADDASLQH